VLAVEDARAGYGERTVLDGIKLSIRQGERIGLLGRNGAGKSTLIRLINGDLAPLAGRRIEGKGLVVGYFAQHQLDILDAQASPLLHLQRIAPRVRDQELRDFLGGFNFHGDMALEPIADFSGGEKARLALALLIWLRPNLLLLDEPTNHLDIDMREALTEALQEYQGALVLVSHDRHLLSTTCDEFLLVHEGRVSPYDGDLDDYARLLAARRAAPVNATEAKGQSRKEIRRDAAKRRNERGPKANGAANAPQGAASTVPLPGHDAPAAKRQNQSSGRRDLEKRSASLEKDLGARTEELRSIDAQLASTEFYGDGSSEAVQNVLSARARLADTIESLEGEWMDLLAQLEKN
jgi:ATP-binding cassette subfamily F protein 3